MRIQNTQTKQLERCTQVRVTCLRDGNVVGQWNWSAKDAFTVAENIDKLTCSGLHRIVQRNCEASVPLDLFRVVGQVICDFKGQVSLNQGSLTSQVTVIMSEERRWNFSGIFRVGEI